MKSQKGITLVSVAIYIVIFFIVLGILATITANMQSGIRDLNSEGTQVAEINKFNMYFLDEVKKQGNAVQEINNTNTQITFTSGKQFQFDDENKQIKLIDLENTLVIAKYIEKCEFEQDEENGKTIIRVTIQAQNSQEITNEYVMNFDYIAYENEENYIVESPIIPKEYQQVLYIESTGTQYIDTGYVFKEKPKIEGKMMITSVADLDIMGTPSATTGCFIIDFTSSKIYYRYSSSSSTVIQNAIHTDTWYDFEFSDSVKVNDVVKGTISTYNFSNNNQTFYIGRGRNYGYCKFQEIKMYDGETLVRDMLPCYRKTDGEVGMYDIVNHTFYTNESGNGSFEIPIIENNLLSNEYQQVKYIQTTGTQYINTGYVFKDKPKILGEINITRIADLDIMGTPVAKEGCFIIDFATGLGNLLYRYSSTESTLLNGFNVDTWYDFEFSDKVIANNIEKGTIETYDFSNNDQTFYIGRGRNYGYACFKRIKIYDGETLVRDLVPCYRKSDNVVGMFDIVNDVFYTNSGTGEFSY